MSASKHHLRAPGRGRPGTRLPTPEPFQGSRPGSSAPALRFLTEHPPPRARASSSSKRQFHFAGWPRSRDPLSPALWAHTHLIAHSTATFRSLTTSLVRKQTAQLVLTESSSVLHRLLLLLPAILPVSGGNAGSWQRPPPPGLHLSRQALPVVASRAAETVGPPENYNPRGALASWPRDGGRSTYEKRGSRWEM